MVTFKTDLAACSPPHLQGDFVNMFSWKNVSLCFLLIACLFQTSHEKVHISESEWCAVVKSAVEQIAKKKNLELLTYLSNTITSEFGFQKYYLLFSPLVGSCWNKQSNSWSSSFSVESSKFWSLRLCGVLISWKLFLSSKLTQLKSFICWKGKYKISREGLVLVFVVSLKNWPLGQPIYVSIALDLHSCHTLLCLHNDSA